MDLDQMLNQKVTLRGTAMDAHRGAVVMLDDEKVVYVEGLDRWTGGAAGKAVQVTGVLAKKKLAPDPRKDAKGVVSHGMQGTQYVLQGATWSASS